jgi:hypothetical protein
MSIRANSLETGSPGTPTICGASNDRPAAYDDRSLNIRRTTQMTAVLSARKLRMTEGYTSNRSSEKLPARSMRPTDSMVLPR